MYNIICNEDNTEIFLRGKDLRYHTSDEIFNLVKCKKCGFVYLNPRPSKREIDKYYPKNYRTRQTLDLSSINRRIKKYRIKRNYVIFENPWYMNFPEGSKILDIGCGSGELLLRLKELKCDGYGIDIDEVTSNYLKEKGLNVINHDADKGLPFSDETFDAVIMRHSIEHFHNPLNVLKEVKRVLKSEGLLIIGIPNINSFTAKISKDLWGDLDLPRHLFHFTPATITKLLKTLNFSVDKIYHESKISRKTISALTKGLPFLTILRIKSIIKLLGFAFMVFRGGEWIVIKAHKK